jgi:hypothetical protein
MINRLALLMGYGIVARGFANDTLLRGLVTEIAPPAEGFSVKQSSKQSGKQSGKTVGDRQDETAHDRRRHHHQHHRT